MKAAASKAPGSSALAFRWLAAAGLVLLVANSACSEGAKFVRLNERGGVVVYPLKKDRENIYASPSRAAALKMIEDHCHGAYLVVREEEAMPQTRNTGLDADDLLTTRRYWGLQFRCK